MALGDIGVKLRRILTWLIIGTTWCFGVTARLSATVLQLGDVEPDVSLWNYYSHQNVGIEDLGSILIDDGSYLQAGYLGLGVSGGSSGSITVSGEDSLLGASGWLLVG